MTWLRSTVHLIGLPLLVILAIASTLVIAPSPAEAGCSTVSTCYFSGGRRICQSESRCVSPRPRICSFVNRCTPQRTCVSTPGRTSCVYRDVCRRVQVCN
ncbi:MAG TPA: hypothetical protein VFQ53_42885 [Kofleriaceae bacterium]|nr:hypothetical protein [Kofleriaceae bacterium]